MTNREKILRTNLYDLMMTIQRSSMCCPIEVMGDKPPNADCEKGLLRLYQCPECIQEWLNAEADQPKPTWHDAMMKNFLRKE